MGGFAALVKVAAAVAAPGAPVEVWFADEARVGQQGTLTRVWARQGSRPRAPRGRRYSSAWLFGAGWHGSARLRVPDNVSLLPLPRYAPELNPVENVWECLRQNWLSHRVCDSYDAVVEACCDAWNMLMRMPERIASITTCAWAQIKP